MFQAPGAPRLHRNRASDGVPTGHVLPGSCPVAANVKGSDRYYFAKLRDAPAHNAGVIGRRGGNVISVSVLSGSSGPTRRLGGSRCSGSANRPCAVVRLLADGLRTAPACAPGTAIRANPALASRRCNQLGRRLLFRQVPAGSPVRSMTVLLCMDRIPAPWGHYSATQAKTSRSAFKVTRGDRSGVRSYSSGASNDIRQASRGSVVPNRGSSKIYAQRMLGKASEHCHVWETSGPLPIPSTALFHSGSRGVLHAVVITASGRLARRSHRWNR